MSNTITDQEILNGLNKNENWAFEHLYKSCYKQVASYVHRNSGSQDESKDIFQDTMVILIKNINKEDFTLSENTKLSTYIFAIGRNLWLAKLKKKGRMNTSSDLDTAINSEKLSTIMDEKNQEVEDKHQMIASKMAELQGDCKQLLELYYYQKTQLKDIASIMNYSEGFVRVKKNRCMNKLKNLVIS